jgi:MFS family permease
LRALDWLNVFLADARDGVGPFLAIFLSSTQHWNAAQIGLAMSVSTITTVAVQTSAGWLVDQSRQKRALIVRPGAGCVAMTIRTTLHVIITAQAIVGIAGAFFPQAIAAITLGLVGHKRMARQVGRNESFNDAGNVLAAALAGVAGQFFGPQAIFILVALMGVGSSLSALAIRAGDIDYELARGATADGNDGKIIPLRDLFRERGIVIFAVSTVLFHFANAAMLPLIGQKLSAGRNGPSLYMAACIIIAQVVMIPIAILAGRHANSWGRRPVFLIGIAVLAIGGLLYTASDNP